MLSSPTSTSSQSPSSSASARRSAPNADFDDYVDPLAGNGDTDTDAGMMEDVTIDDGYNNNNGGMMGEEDEQQQDQQVIVNSSTSKSWMILLVAIVISLFSLLFGNNGASSGINSTITNTAGLESSAVSWSLFIITISLLICLSVNVCYLFPNSSSCSKVFVTTKSGRLIELILVSFACLCFILLLRENYIKQLISLISFFFLFYPLHPSYLLFPSSQSVLMFLLWCVGLIIIMNPSNSIAVGYTQIVNGNLYIGSWICFSCTVYIVGNLLHDLFGQRQQEGGIPVGAGSGNLDLKSLFWNTRRGKWYALVVTSGIVLSSSVRTYQAFDCYLSGMTSVNVCIDTKVGITMSVIGGILAVLFSCVSSSGIAVTNNASNDNVDVDENNNDNDGMNTINNNSNNNSNNNIARLIESVGVVVTTIVWTIAWGFITFGEGPVRYVKLHDMFSYVFPMSLLP